MRQFDVKIRISAADEAEMKERYKALDTLQKNLSTKDLKTVADEIRKNPAIIEKVKKIANNPIVQGLI